MALSTLRVLSRRDLLSLSSCVRPLRKGPLEPTLLAESYKKLTGHLESRLLDKDEQIEQLKRDSAEAVAQYCAVMCNRIWLDLGLRAMYPKVRQFTARYEKFLSEVVFLECQLSPAAVEIYNGLSKQCHGKVTKTETEKELSAFAHNSSKVFYHLGHHLPRGLYCGGD
eukprot:scpid105068/ scgid18100/ 